MSSDKDGNLAFPIPNSVLEPYIKQAVSSAITGALGDGTRLVELAVQQALTTKVNERGSVGQSYENKFQFIEVVAAEKIRSVARESINQMAEAMRPKIKEQIEKQLMEKHSAIAQCLVDSLISSLSASWSVSVSIQAPKG